MHVDHARVLLKIPLKYSISSIMGHIKGKGGLLIYEKWENVRHREFWCRGYYVNTVGKGARKIAEYIKNQLKENVESDQLTMGITQFTGNK